MVVIFVIWKLERRWCIFSRQKIVCVALKAGLILDKHSRQWGLWSPRMENLDNKTVGLGYHVAYPVTLSFQKAKKLIEYSMNMLHYWRQIWERCYGDKGWRWCLLRVVKIKNDFMEVLGLDCKSKESSKTETEERNTLVTNTKDMTVLWWLCGNADSSISLNLTD